MDKVKLNPIQDFFIFLGVLFLLFVVWVSTGGPDRLISHQGPYLNPPPPLGNGQGYDLVPQKAGAAVADGSRISNESASNSSVVYTGPTPGTQVPSGASANSPATEYLELSLPANTSSLSLSGLYVADNTGIHIAIPNGASLTSLGTVPSQGPIVLTPGARAYIISGRSPVGVSFRLNACSGFLAQYQSFTPPLPLPPFDASSYPGCVAKHSGDADFEKNEWRIYLGRDKRLWDRSYSIWLADKNGRQLLSFVKR